MHRSVQPSALSALCSSAVAILLVALSPARAQLPSARLHTVFPPGGAAGSTVEIAIGGADLDDATELRFSHPGIRATPKVRGENPLLGRDLEPGRFVVEIAADVPVGEYDVRAIGSYGISSPRKFAVDRFAEHTEGEANNDAATANDIGEGGVVNARIDGGADVDHFKVRAKAGQWLIADCLAERIDSRLEAFVAILDVSGRPLVERAHGGDPYVEHRVEADGEYIIQVRDRIYRGGSEYVYRLRVTTGPWILGAFPPVVEAGKEAEVAVFGRNLPDASQHEALAFRGAPVDVVKRTIQAPGEGPATVSRQSPYAAFVAMFDARFSERDPPIPFGIARHPVVVESEDNDDAVAATKVAVPCELAGRFFPRGDRDWVEFDAEKGATFRLDLVAHRAGASVDPYMVVYQVTGSGESEEMKELQRVDDQGGVKSPYFNAETDDPAWTLTAPETARYRVLVRDLYGDAQADFRNAYRLIIRPPEPGFELVAMPVAPALDNDKNKNAPADATIFLRPGDVEPVEVVAQRIDGFDGRIEIVAEGLPDGVTMAPAAIERGQSQTTLWLAADPAAQPWVGSLGLAGRAKVGEAEIVAPARSSSITWAADGQRGVIARMVDSLSLAISAVEKSGVVVEPEAELIAMARAGKVRVPVKLATALGFKGKTSIEAVDLPPNVGAKRIEIEEKDASGALELEIGENAPVGESSIVIVARGQVEYPRGAHKAAELEAKKTELEALAPEAEAAATAARQTKEAFDKDYGAAQSALEAAGAAVAKERRALADLAAAPPADGTGTPTQKIEAATDALIREVEARVRAQDLAASLEARKEAIDRAAQEKGAAREALASALEAVKQRAAQAVEAAKPKNVRFCAHSRALRLRIVEAPVRLAVPATVVVNQGAKQEIEVAVERLFDFADEVRLAVEIPGEAKGVTIAGATIAKDETATKLAVEAAADAAQGDFTLRLVATMKFGGKDLKTTVAFPMKVASP